MRSNDLVSKFFYVLLASFAAPVWEEAIFRGFLFASLSSFINARAAMLISSTLFAVAHFSLELLSIGKFASSNAPNPEPTSISWAKNSCFEFE